MNVSNDILTIQLMRLPCTFYHVIAVPKVLSLFHRTST